MEDKSCPVKETFKSSSKKHIGIKDIRYILAVGSGKGGVGKTTLSVLLALALKDAGYLTGIFDLDFYGPNISLLLGVKKVPIIEFGKIKPVVCDKIKVLSLGLLVSEKEPIFMRGLMASKLLQELIEKVEWGPLDFLILDLPPGTGDIFLSVCDLFELEGFILVTTPHKLALADARRTLTILRENKIPIFGVVKNMSDFFENTPYFDKFLEEEHLSLLFEIPFIKELSIIENFQELFKIPEKKKLLENLAEKILDKVFRIY